MSAKYRLLTLQRRAQHLRKRIAANPGKCLSWDYQEASALEWAVNKLRHQPEAEEVMSWAFEAVNQWAASSNTDNPEFEGAMANLERAMQTYQDRLNGINEKEGTDGQQPTQQTPA